MNSWGGGFQADVSVTAGSAAIRGWRVAWTFANGQTISQLWNGTLSQSGANVAVTNLGYNGALSAGASTSFGFSASQSGTNAVPAVTCTAS